MDIKKSKILCLIFLNMAAAEIDRIVDAELDKTNKQQKPELVESLINTLDDIDICIEELGKEFI